MGAGCEGGHESPACLTNGHESPACLTNQRLKLKLYPLLGSSPQPYTKATFRAPMNLDVLRSIASSGTFFSYAAGVAYKILQDYKVSGIEINCYRCTLPVAKGLSSSAAACVLLARSFNRLFNLRGTTRFEMENAYRSVDISPPPRSHVPVHSPLSIPQV